MQSISVSLKFEMDVRRANRPGAVAELSDLPCRRNFSGCFCFVRGELRFFGNSNFREIRLVSIGDD
jgi:hypothetical protein